MKIAESWLREWVNPDLDTEALAHQLTMTGHEVDGVEPQGLGLEDVVIAEVLEAEQHPNADRLRVCQVSDGSGETLEIVCGAPNAVAGMKTPLAKPGVTLPNGITLKQAKIRGVVSNGMLCSSDELGLGSDSDGIIRLPDDAPVGERLIDFLQLPDATIDLSLTPNRGDCFSVLGIARDVSALSGAELKSADVAPVTATIDDTQAVVVEFNEGCPAFAGRLIKGINPNAASPIWMTERLRRSGLRPISPVVDITNYVMLELGQPLHAYDAAKVQGAIVPRLARSGEKVTLLDEKVVDLNDDTMVITDDSGVIGIAGIMGGLSTAVSDETVDVYFEGAFWTPIHIAGRARSYGMHTDASMRFERGVDPNGQARAVERASELLLQIAGGDAGPIEVHGDGQTLPQPSNISLRRERLSALLGVEIDDARVADILTNLGMEVTATDRGWDVVAPAFRFDIAIEADLIEEVARIFGYDNIPEATAIAATPLEPLTETQISTNSVADVLTGRDYQEVVTYSFVEPSLNETVTGEASELVLTNPISSEMSVMRSSLLTGLLQAAASNVARQQSRVRLFEIGKAFTGALGSHNEPVRIGGISVGTRGPEQWAEQAQPIDFYDIKADVEAILGLLDSSASIDFEAVKHPALQPGQAASILRDGESIGVIGKLHPRLKKPFDLKPDAFVFELDAAKTLSTTIPIEEAVSKFPSIRRDIAVVVDENILAQHLVAEVRSAIPDLVAGVRIFDVYQGPGVEAGLKSVALGLILQETSRTLTDDDADSAMAAAVQKLHEKFGAELRE
ncbi:MAG: phenylalanine--tRNA ligase subunit beta [Pseudomonadota bacterium]